MTWLQSIPAYNILYLVTLKCLGQKKKKKRVKVSLEKITLVLETNQIVDTVIRFSQQQELYVLLKLMYDFRLIEWYKDS